MLLGHWELVGWKPGRGILVSALLSASRQFDTCIGNSVELSIVEGFLVLSTEDADVRGSLLYIPGDL
jgi:hypothetical protein